MTEDNYDQFVQSTFIHIHSMFCRGFFLAFKMHSLKNVLESLQSKSQAGDYFILTLLLISLLFFAIGLVGYQANFVQLGLDQLFEAPNHYSGLFIHYASRSFHLGVTPLAIFPVVWCNHPRFAAHLVLYSTPVIVTVVLIIVVIIMKWKKHWFFTKAGQENPYKLVIRVINFARKHKYPLQRSAFT